MRERLEAAGIKLPVPMAPAAAYLATRLHGDLLYCAGVTSQPGGGPVKGDEDLPAACLAAGEAAQRQLAAIEAAIGSLDTVAYMVRVTGYVACAPAFTRCPEVLNAASQVFITAFGQRGQHARSAIGVSALPGGATVELEAVVAVRPEGD